MWGKKAFVVPKVTCFKGKIEMNSCFTWSEGSFPAEISDMLILDDNLHS